MRVPLRKLVKQCNVPKELPLKGRRRRSLQGQQRRRGRAQCGQNLQLTGRRKHRHEPSAPRSTSQGLKLSRKTLHTRETTLRHLQCGLHSDLINNVAVAVFNSPGDTLKVSS